MEGKIILIGIILLYSCNPGNKQKPELNEHEGTKDTSFISYLSPWEETYIYKPQGDTTGWYLNEKNQWVDTMRDYHQMYSFYPPFDNNKVFYSNITVHLFEEQTESILYNAQDKVKVFVKTLDQQPIMWFYPLKDSKMLSTTDKIDFKIQEKDYTGVSGVLLKNDHYQWIQFHTYQYGQVIFSVINLWRFGPDGMENTQVETNLYDLDGNLFYSVIEDAVMPTATVTLNKKYLLTCSGGQLTENEKDTKPFVGRMYDIENDSLIWEDYSEEFQINFEADVHSNWTRLTYVKNYNWEDSDNSIVLLDLNNNIYYKFLAHDKCKAGEVRMRFEPKQFIYFTTRQGDKIVEKELKLDTDFIKIDQLPISK